MAEIEDLTLRQLRDIRREQREITTAVRELSTTVREFFDYVRQQGVGTETRLVELDRAILQAREEIELTVKMEVGGRMAGFESNIEGRIEEALSARTLGDLTGDDRPD